jgi:tetratricopeptide (TPR) repeat protein
LSDLHFVYREAKKSGDRTSIGTTLMNLSREYQKLGALSVAMKHSQRSVAVLSKNAGNLAYYLALVHRAHLYCELGAYADAKVDLDAALCSKFPEIHSAAKALESLHPSVRLEGRANKASSGARTATWTERLSGGDESASVKLSKLEQRILELLSQKARSKSELIEALYGSRLSLEVTQNRLHNLMNRLRKKFPALISFGDGNYFLSESPFLKLKKAKR